MDLEGFLIPLLPRFGSYSIQFHCWVCRYWSWLCISWSEASDRVFDFQLLYAGYIIYILLASVSMYAIDHVINSVAKSNYMSAGQINVPIVFRGPNGPAAGVGAQHSQVCLFFLLTL
uniref:Pyruvate dehydrogenase E1 component subunit beta n=1 Tax=Helianthus annuus TaxID=4232 RepID=A0A251V4N7_HELAN